MVEHGGSQKIDSEHRKTYENLRKVGWSDSFPEKCTADHFASCLDSEFRTNPYMDLCFVARSGVENLQKGESCAIIYIEKEKKRRTE